MEEELQHHQEQRFRFRLLSGGGGDGVGVRSPSTWLEVAVVGVRPATFNTASFLRRQKDEHDLLEEEEGSGEERCSGQANAAEKEAETKRSPPVPEQAGQQPLFCVTSHVVWRTSELMARWLGSRAELFRMMMVRKLMTMTGHERRLRVLELGCGLGLAGLACAKVCTAVRNSTPSHATDVSRVEPPLIVMTDGDAAALQLLEHNLDLNWADQSEGRPQAARLVWGDQKSMRQLRKSRGEQAFDVILGADIIYHRTDYEALVDTIGFFLGDEIHPQAADRSSPETPPSDGVRWKISNVDALVAIAMQERQYGARDHLVQQMRGRLGMDARVLDVPLLFAEDDGDDEDDEADRDGYWLGGNHYMVIFHHPQTTLPLDLLGPEMVIDGHEDEEEQQLLLSISPP